MGNLGQIPARKKSGHPVRGKTFLHCGDQAQRRPTGASRGNRSASTDASRNPQLVQRFHRPLGFLAQLGKGDRHLFGSRASIETIAHQPRQVPNFLAWTRSTEEFQMPLGGREQAGRGFAREQNAPQAGQRAVFTGRVPLQNIQRAKRRSPPFQNRKHLVNRQIDGRASRRRQDHAKADTPAIARVGQREQEFQAQRRPVVDCFNLNLVQPDQ